MLLKNKKPQARLLKGKTITRYTSCVVLCSTLLLSACDGGIFGTGGADDGLIIDGDANSEVVAGIPVDSDTTQTDNDGQIDSNVEQSSDTAVPTDSLTDENVDVATDAGNSAGSDGGSDAGTSTIDGNTGGGGDTDTGSDTDTDDVSGGADSGTGADSGASTDAGDGVDNGSSGANNPQTLEPLTNNTQTPNNTAARLNLYNASNFQLNVFDLTVEPNRLLFAPEGIAPSTMSPSIDLESNSNSLSIVNADNAEDVLVLIPSLEAQPSTLTSIIARESNQAVNAIALVTETATTDAALARVRIVQASTLDNAEVPLTAQLLSAGENPGGIDIVFESISFDFAATAYNELPAGDYQLSDVAERITPAQFSFTGGTVYTILITNNGADGAILINDTQAGQ